MGRVNCPVCQEWHWINDLTDRPDHCYACGWEVPINEKGEYEVPSSVLPGRLPGNGCCGGDGCPDCRCPTCGSDDPAICFNTPPALAPEGLMPHPHDPTGIVRCCLDPFHIPRGGANE